MARQTFLELSRSLAWLNLIEVGWEPELCGHSSSIRFSPDDLASIKFVNEIYCLQVYISAFLSFPYERRKDIEWPSKEENGNSAILHHWVISCIFPQDQSSSSRASRVYTRTVLSCYPCHTCLPPLFLSKTQTHTSSRQFDSPDSPYM